MKTARSAILGWILIPLLFAMIATYVSIGVVLRDSLAVQIDDQLGQEAKELSVLADKATDPKSGLPYTSAQELLELFIRSSVPDSDETLFVLVDGVVTERSSSPGLARIDRVPEFIEIIAALEEPLFSNYTYLNQDIRFIAIPVSGSEDSGHMVAAIFLEQKMENINSTLNQLALLMLLAFGVASAAGWFVAGRILDPIRRLGAITRRITDGTTQERLDDLKGTSEIGAIAEDFNKMLDRTAKAFDSQKRFVDDAGHELKTPLTIIQGHLDLMKSSPQEAEASLAIIHDEVSRMTRIVKDLQMLTKSSESSFVVLSDVEPSEIIDEVFVKASPLATRNWRVDSAKLKSMPLDRQRMVQALVQLVDNAIKHTNESDSLVIGCRSTNGVTEFYVGDSGPGIPEDSRTRVQERFVRGGWTAQDTEGSGLGLAIVGAIAKGHGGQLVISTSPLGGAEVAIRVGLATSGN